MSTSSKLRDLKTKDEAHVGHEVPREESAEPSRVANQSCVRACVAIIRWFASCAKHYYLLEM
eukprot:scaffold6378_cov112-Isochrysis_galbana.AAC.1